jgi:hypothetical protein
MAGTAKPASLYRDRWIECTENALVISGYYLPWGGKKTIPYAKIHGVEEIELNLRTGKYRIWGSGDFKHWAHVDPYRPHKQRGLIVDVGSRIQPLITPDDTGKVRAIIETRRREAQGN